MVLGTFIWQPSNDLIHVYFGYASIVVGIILMIEAQADYLARLLAHARTAGADTLEVRPEAEAAWNEFVQRGLARTVWPGGCHSWYQDAGGRVFSLWPHTTSRFIREMRRAPPEEYRLSSAP